MDSGWRPDVLLSIWRGGAPIGIAVHEYLEYHGFSMRQAVLRVHSYTGPDQHHTPTLENASEALNLVVPGSRVLVVDDIFDSGRTLTIIRNLLAPRAQEVRLAAVFWRTNRENQSGKPDYHVHRTDRWVVFPHELAGLTPEEIRQKGEDLWPLLK